MKRNASGVCTVRFFSILLLHLNVLNSGLFSSIANRSYSDDEVPVRSVQREQSIVLLQRFAFLFKKFFQIPLLVIAMLRLYVLVYGFSWAASECYSLIASGNPDEIIVTAISVASLMTVLTWKSWYRNLNCVIHACSFFFSYCHHRNRSRGTTTDWA